MTALEPLDLLLYNAEPRAWGAHIGVYLGDDHVVHLSREVGVPAIRRQADFAAHSRYACFVGAKRTLGPSTGGVG